jgi:hypothetical protein
MNHLTESQLAALEKTIVRPTAKYYELSVAERRALVAASRIDPELESIKAKDLLAIATTMDNGEPDFYLVRILLERHDPASVVHYLNDDVDHMMFIEAFGYERVRSFQSVAFWFSLYSEVEKYCDFRGTCKKEIGRLLESHGPESVTGLVRDAKEFGCFVEIFGTKAIRLLDKAIANKFKGAHLEDRLGL